MTGARPKDPPSTSSSEEDGFESSSEEVNKFEDKPHTKQQENKGSSDDGESEEESDEGEEESSEEEKAEPTPKISPQKKPPTTDGSPAMVSKRETKRISEEPNKKQKTVVVADGYESNKATFSSEKKRPAFTRVWSEGDEIALLKGMIEFESDKGTDPMSDMNMFYEDVRKSNSIQFDASNKQIIDKIKKLKKKYKDNVGRFAGSDENPVFSKAHDSEVFHLSKQIWKLGANPAAGSKRSVAVSKKSKAIVPADVEHKVNHCEKEVSEMYPFIYETMRCMDEMNFLKGLDLSVIGKSMMEDLEQKFKKHKLAEVALAYEKMKYVKDVFQLMGTSGY